MADIAETIPHLQANSNDPACAAYWQGVAANFRENANSLPADCSPAEAKNWLGSVSANADVSLAGITLPAALDIVGAGASYFQITKGIINGEGKDIILGVVGLKTGCIAAGIAVALGIAGGWVALIGAAVSVGLPIALDWLITTGFPSFFNAAQQFLRTVFADPLVFDMDGDGIETVAANAGNPVYFDFSGDGTRTSAGWISPDDAYLVFDRNHNGVIDDASELFSDYTPLHAGGRAANGFVALAQEDSNADGVVNHLDANWGNLRVWRDLNSDGISQSEELLSLEEAGITGLNVAKTNTTQTLANGNSIRGTGTYIKEDGTTGVMGDVYFAVDTVNRQFSNPIPVSPEVEGLPDMQGSGLVRDLQQAAMLSPVLRYLLVQYSEATTRQEQMAILDQLLYAWADTSGMAATMDSRNPEHYRIQYNGFGNVTRSGNTVSGDGGTSGGGTGGGVGPYIPDAENMSLTPEYRVAIA